jgi:hypothetical protein
VQRAAAAWVYRIGRSFFITKPNTSDKIFTAAGVLQVVDNLIENV